MASEAARIRSCGWRLVLIGLGNIGAFTAMLLARLPEVRELLLIDCDSYTAENLAGQHAEPRDVGRPKALAVARRLRALCPGLRVQAVCAHVQDVPAALLRCGAVLGAVDNNRTRMYLSETCWALETPLVDAGVSTEHGAVRVTVLPMAEVTACMECSWSVEDYDALGHAWRCGGQVVDYDAEPTRASASIGALAASLQVIRTTALLRGEQPPAQAQETILETLGGNLFVSDLPRNRDCRFDHLRWRTQEVAAANLGDIAARAAADGLSGEMVLSAGPRQFATRLSCAACGRSRPALFLHGRSEGRARRCSCGSRMQCPGFFLRDGLALSACSARQLARPLAAIGLRDGDVVSVSADTTLHYELQGSGF